MAMHVYTNLRPQRQKKITLRDKTQEEVAHNDFSLFKDNLNDFKVSST